MRRSTSTFLVFGFDMAFKTPPETICSKVKGFLKSLFSLAFIFMALNGYYHDVMKVYHAHMGGLLGCAVVVLVWATSPNYVAFQAIWISLYTQNPALALKLKPKYNHIGGIPLVPGRSKWLPPLKHVYALLLAPYWLLQMPLTLASNCFCTVWIASKCCLPAAVCVKAFFAFPCAVLGVIVSLGFWSWARDASGYWYPLFGACFCFALMQLWASDVAPMLFSWIYARLLGVPTAAYYSDVLKKVAAIKFDVIKNTISLSLDDYSLKKEAIIEISWDKSARVTCAV